MTYFFIAVIGSFFLYIITIDIIQHIYDKSEYQIKKIIGAILMLFIVLSIIQIIVNQ